MSKITTLIIILSICTTSCGQQKTGTMNKNSKTGTTEIDTSKIAILPYGKNLYWIFKDGKPAELSKKDMLKIEDILKKSISNYNSNLETMLKKRHPKIQLDKERFVIHLKDYKRQYVAIKNLKGEKIVWVNCFCTILNQRWKKEIFVVDDGGKCFFNLKINLTTGQYYEFKINGNA